VVIGASFIGLEVTASLTALGIKVIVLNMDDRLWPNVMPPEVAALVQQDFEARGVEFRHRTRVTGFDGKDMLEVIQTNAGDVEASVAVVGAGIQLNTELAAAAGLAVQDGIVVDEHLRTSAAGIYAAGDVASYPDALAGTDDAPVRRRVEHWDNAIAQGKVAAANMVGKRMAYRRVPYFWTDLFETTINVVGYLDGADETIVRGSLDARRFTLLYLRGGVLRGALMMNAARDRRAAAELISRRVPISEHRDRLADPTFKLAGLVPAE
jgi:3-phenylpropionate/trans-cinnamate dioxygenase ferredoxin reductase component